MMLLDTHIWLWWINGTPGRLSPSVIKRIEQAKSVAVSAISCFELEWLARHGRIELEISLDDWFSSVFSETEIICLPVTGQIARLAASLPEHHKDPQDRLIIATAIINTCHLVSADRQFSRYSEISELLLQA